MKFNIVKSERIKNIEERYIFSEQSFDSYNSTNTDITISVAYLILGVSSSDMYVKCLWGFSPRENWQAKKLDVPFSEEGELQLLGNYDGGTSIRIDNINDMWESYFDEYIGWFCIGDPTNKKGDRAVRIAQNMIVAINNSGNLKSIFIKPIFVDKHWNSKI